MYFDTLITLFSLTSLTTISFRVFRSAKTCKGYTANHNPLAALTDQRKKGKKADEESLEASSVDFISIITPGFSLFSS